MADGVKQELWGDLTSLPQEPLLNTELSPFIRIDFPSLGWSFQSAFEIQNVRTNTPAASQRA